MIIGSIIIIIFALFLIGGIIKLSVKFTWGILKLVFSLFSVIIIVAGLFTLLFLIV